MQTAKSISLICICTVVLCACGNKGKLYLPEDKPAATPVVVEETAQGQQTKDDEQDDDEQDKAKQDKDGQNEAGQIEDGGIQLTDPV